MSASLRVIPALFTLGMVSPLLHAMDSDLRIVPQVLINNAGFEPGVALELRAATNPVMTLRPELLLTDGGDDIGGGFSLLFGVLGADYISERSHISVGPRFIHHNDDDYGWDAGAATIWDMALDRGLGPMHHFIEVIGVVGIIQDREDDDVDPSLTLGAAYGYRF